MFMDLPSVSSFSAAVFILITQFLLSNELMKLVPGCFDKEEKRWRISVGLLSR